VVALSHLCRGCGQYAGAALLLLFVAALCSDRAGRLRAEEPAAPSWVVAESHAPAVVRFGEGQWQALPAGAAVEPGSEIRTGDGGMVVLRRGGDHVRLLANSTLALPAEKDVGAMTRLKLWFGRAFFQVKSRPSWSFEVDTPYLVGIVKGTAFTVDVSRFGSTIAVSSGLVAVSKAGGPAVDVGVGKTARAYAGLEGIAVTETPGASAGSAPQAAPHSITDALWPTPEWKPVQ
jgi:ferric-dicitrate binding protein FerR (iron transport regulator)